VSHYPGTYANQWHFLEISIIYEIEMPKTSQIEAKIIRISISYSIIDD
jgi:hypothetical protein